MSGVTIIAGLDQGRGIDVSPHGPWHNGAQRSWRFNDRPRSHFSLDRMTALHGVVARWLELTAREPAALAWLIVRGADPGLGAR